MGKRKLSTKLSLSIVLMAVPIFVLAIGMLFFKSRQFFQQEAKQRADNALNTVMQQVRNYMTTIETATNANAWLVEENSHPDSLLAISRRIVQLNRHANGCSITAEPDIFPLCGKLFSAYSIREGDSIITAREAEYNYYEKSWYKTPQQLGKACWVDPFDDYNDGTLYTTEFIASYCRPFFLADGRMAGVISTDLSFHHLSETINRAEPPYPNAYYVLLGSDGRYLIHPDSTRLFGSTVFTDYTPEKNADVIALGHEMLAGNQGHMPVTVNDQLFHVSYCPVTGTNWSLALVCPNHEIMKGYYQLTNIVLILIILGLLAILWLCRRVVNHSVRPITYLAERSQRILDGHYDEIIPTTDRVDAIGQLQNSFAAMQQSINERVAGIRQATEDTQKRNEELVVARQKAEEAVKQKGLFIQDVSHQIRTPLNIVLGFADVLRNNPQASEDMSQISGMMRYNARHLRRMIIMLYDSSDTAVSAESKMQKNDRVLCNDVARECITFAIDHIPEMSIRFETTLPDDVAIKTNRLYLMRCIRELLFNAAKYSDGTHIVLSVSQTETTVRFVVEDQGSGIPESSQDLIFDTFSKIDSLSEGLGLGLPLSKRHALSLGGNLILDPDYHDGCRFILELPK